MSKLGFVKKSPWISFMNTGGCNGCAIEVLATRNPKYDVERLGIQIKGSVKHCDILVVTGQPTMQCMERVQKIYEQMYEPKLVVAVGACAISGNMNRFGYSFVGPFNKVVPVDVFVPGCPPRPEAIIDGIIKALNKYDKIEEKEDEKHD